MAARDARRGRDSGPRTTQHSNRLNRRLREAKPAEPAPGA
jgi:hypothetical protein